VVYCSDSQEVADFVLGLAKERGAHLIVKSKSMTTEEIHFNERLEKHGLEAVETDLGEYILQLAHQRPYHIVAPALHLTRYDVAEIFTKNLGVENEVVIEKQTKIARAALREKFLHADIGVTGANFLVADSGAVVVVENEGNARLTTSAPKIHITVAGIEKLIPRAQDLGVFLTLLGRSATGQPLTVYTSFLSGPRRNGEIDGPDEFYVVLLDNGRTKLLADPEKAPVAVLHSLRCVPESLPGVSQNRRAQLSVGLFRSHWSHHHAAVSRCAEGSLASVRIQSVRRVRRSLSGQDRNSEAVIEAALGSDGRPAAPRRGGCGAVGVRNLGVGDDASADLLDAGAHRRDLLAIAA